MWNPLGVIESFMNATLPFCKGMEDFCYLLERVGLLRYTQADTERVVKTVRKVEKRFNNFNEVKQAIGKRDRASQEIFITRIRLLSEIFRWTINTKSGCKHTNPL